MIEDFEIEELGTDETPVDKIEIEILGVTEADIIEAIKVCLKVSPLINPSKTLINSVYAIIKGLFIENKKYVILEAPTGSGKTIIGFISFFVIQYLYRKKNGENNVQQVAYTLTSAKMLQEQIDQDLDRFVFRNNICILKGVANYDCLPETERVQRGKFFDNMGVRIDRVSYADRPCKGLTKKERSATYPCDAICPYQLARYEGSEKACTVLNYAYFLNIMRADFNPFFGTRLLTIADEAHLIPEIVCNIFNFEFTQFIANQLFKLSNELQINFEENVSVELLKKNAIGLFKYFTKSLVQASLILEYFEELKNILLILGDLKKNENFTTYKLQISKNIDRLSETLQTQENFINLVAERPEDVYFESVLIAHDKLTDSKVFKHIIRDLSEAMMVKKHFLSKLNKGIFMSATLGDIDEYAEMMGMEKSEYLALRLPSTFNFDKSPVYLCKSSWLNYANFDKNIDKALTDTIHICNHFHPKEKGIIHTSTFKICALFIEKINLGLVPDKERFLFYQNAEEKQKLVDIMKQSSKPYVIVGPSLYEGLDLKDDQGRFNILIKVPYAGIDAYIKKKMERFPFWYNRNTKEKIVQAIGRTNRHTEDYSTVYLIDGCFDKLIYETNDSIVSRLKSKKIY